MRRVWLVLCAWVLTSSSMNEPRPLPLEVQAAVSTWYRHDERFEHARLSDGQPIMTRALARDIAHDLQAAAAAMSERRYDVAAMLLGRHGLTDGAAKDDKQAYRRARQRTAVWLGEATVEGATVKPYLPSMNGLPAREGRPATPPAPKLTALLALGRRAELMADMVRVGVEPRNEPPTYEDVRGYVRAVATQAAEQDRDSAVAGALEKVMRGAFMHFRNAGGVDLDFGQNEPERFVVVVGDALVVREDERTPRLFESREAARAFADEHPLAQVYLVPSRTPDGDARDPWRDITAPERRVIAGMHEADCESFARIGATLIDALRDQGFVVLGHIVVSSQTPTGHSLTVYRAPSGSVWISSNDTVRRVDDNDADGAISHQEIMRKARLLVGEIYHVDGPATAAQGFRFTPGVAADPLAAARMATELDVLNAPDLRHRYGIERTPEPRFDAQAAGEETTQRD